MSLKIRLARAGTKKRPVYHIVVADSRSPRDGRFIERLGYFNPLLPKEKTERLKFDAEKAKAWMAKGATPDRPRVALPRRGRPDDARDAQQSDPCDPAQAAQGHEGRGREGRSGRQGCRRREGQSRSSRRQQQRRELTSCRDAAAAPRSAFASPRSAHPMACAAR